MTPGPGAGPAVMGGPVPAGGSLVDELRRRASVLSWFEVEWLGMDPSTERYDDAVADLLLSDAQRTRVDGARRWRVGDDVRRAAAREGWASLRSAWAAVARRPDDEVQRVIDRLVGEGRPVELAGAPRERLEAVGVVSRWFEALGPPVPAHAEVEGGIRFQAMLDPLRAVASEHFRDRADELRRLGEVAPAGGDVVVLMGRGGIGKSALLGRHLLAAAEAGSRVCYLNFDHAALDPLSPASLVAEMATQLSWQVGAAAQPELERVVMEAGYLARNLDSGTLGASRTLNVEAERWRPLLDQMAAVLRNDARDLVVAFDTIEEAQRRDWTLSSLRRLVDAAAGALPRCTVVASGRSGGEHVGGRTIELQGLPRDDAGALLVALLEGSGTAVSPEERDAVLDVVGTSPLCVRLAAGLLRASPDGLGPFRGLRLNQAAVEGELYRRLLGHIPDDTVRKLAHPGLTLRRITPDLIQRVLARPCGVAVPDADRARELFEKLAAEGMLVERGFDDGGPVLLHRSDIRPLMLEQQLATAERDVVERIHRAAVRYYAADPTVAGRIEELYHRLMLSQARSTIDRRWVPEAAAALVQARAELPPSARAYLLDKDPSVEDAFSPAELDEVADENRRAVLERQVERLVASGAVDEALAALERYRAADGSSLLPVIELQVNELLGRFETALAIAEHEQDRLAGSGNKEAVVELALHRARLWERLGALRQAAEHLAGLLAEVERSSRGRADDGMRLRLVVALLRLDRFDAAAAGRDVLVGKAVELFGRLGRRRLLADMALLRDLGAELGADAPPEVLRLVLEAGAVEDRDGSLAEALAQWDAELSRKRGRDHGVLAELVELAEEPQEAGAWHTWIEHRGASKAASALGVMVGQFEGEVTTELRGSITRELRQQSDAAHDFGVSDA